MWQLATFHIALARIPRKCHLNLWREKKMDVQQAFLFLCLDFCARWTMTVRSSFMLQHLPTTRPCDYLNLILLYIVSNVPSIVFNCKFENASKWLVLVWFVMIKINNGLIVFYSIHGNSPLCTCAFKVLVLYYWLITMKIIFKFRVYSLKPCTISRIGIIAYILLLITYCTPFIVHVLASLPYVITKLHLQECKFIVEPTQHGVVPLNFKTVVFDFVRE